MKLEASDPSLAEELPYWEFASHPLPHLILSDGSIVGGLNMDLLDVECFDASRLNQLTLSLRSALNSVPEGSSVQFYLSVTSDCDDVVSAHEALRAPDCHPIIGGMSSARVEALRDAIHHAELYRPKLFVFLRIPKVQVKKLGFFKTEEEFTGVTLSAYEDAITQLSDGLEGLEHGLRASGLESSTMTTLEQLNLVYRTLNPSRSRTVDAPALKSDAALVEGPALHENPWLGAQSPREQLSFGDLVISHDSVLLDSKIHRVISLKTLPEVTVAGQLANVLRLPFHYDLALTFHVPSQSVETSALERKRRMAHSLASNPGGGVSDLESETKLSATEELLRELLNTGQRIYASQLHFVIRAEATPEGHKRLARQSREVLSRLRALQGAEGLEETVGTWKVMKGALPGAPVRLERAKKMKTNNLADFLPIYGPMKGDKSPVVIFRNRLNGLVAFDAFDSNLPNYNSLVTGSSGAGKSFLNNCILLQELAKGQRIFIVDIGGSYRKLTEALGGQYLEINLSESNRINPFHLSDPSLAPSDQKLKNLVATVESMVSDDDSEKLSKIDRVLLEKDIVELFEECSKLKRSPILSDLAKRLEKSPEPSMRTLAKMLYTWTDKRPYGRLVDGEGALRTDANICTFDLKGLSSYPDLQRVMLLILTDFIIGQVEGDKTSQKRIILDEVWQLLKSTSAANFMEYCVRTLRKTGSGITFITQGVEEIAASPIGSAILNNTATKFVMLQRGDMNSLAKNLKLNSRELELISSLQQRKGEYSEGFVIKGEARSVVRVCPTPEEYWLATSDARDNAFLEQLRSEGLSIAEALKRASLEYPNGVAQGRKEAT